MAAVYRWLLPYSVPPAECMINPRANGDLPATHMRMRDRPVGLTHEYVVRKTYLACWTLDEIYFYDRKLAIHEELACIDHVTLPDAHICVYEHTDTHSQRGGTLQPRLYYPGVCWGVGGRSPRDTTHIG